MEEIEKWRENFESENLNEDEKEILKQMGMGKSSRRKFVKNVSAASMSIWASSYFSTELYANTLKDFSTNTGTLLNEVKVNIRINNSSKSLTLDSRMSLLDALREKLALTGTKKGCDHGQCGACTVIIDGKRNLSCLTLAATCENKDVTTIEGLANENGLHPMQQAFIDHDGFQCGYCTSGQICSSVALLEEAKNGEASFVTKDFTNVDSNLKLSEEEIRERMSGNICRCGAYNNIVQAFNEVHSGKSDMPTWAYATQEQMEKAKKV